LEVANAEVLQDIWPTYAQRISLSGIASVSRRAGYHGSDKYGGY
jgi:hypothetical protein